jgi:hypothetical protein
MAIESGFDILVLDSVGGPFVVISDILGKAIQMIPIVGRTVATYVQRLCLILLGKRPQSLTFPIFVGAILMKRFTDS